jgi:membrane fusion protein, multidrug efflux system
MMADSAIVQAENANYSAQKTMYSYLTVTAPFDGIITERNVHPGALVGPNMQSSNKPMLELQQQNMLRLTASIPEQYSAQVSDGEKVHYRINAIPGKLFEGRISRSSGSLNEHYRSETIEVDVPSNGQTIKAGMYAELIIPASGSVNAFVVPKGAIVTGTERKYVIKIVDHTTKYIDVSQGNENGDSVEIFGDLNPGDQIVASANETIKQGVRVK